MNQLLEDLDVIGHLDHDPACDPASGDCDQTAAWWLHNTRPCCGGVEDRFLCHAHKREVDALIRALNRTAGLVCLLCGAKPIRPDITIRPLRGGDHG